MSDRTRLAEARAAHPELTIYFEQEIDELMTIVAGRKGEQEAGLLRIVNMAKKELRGWVVPGMGSSGLGLPDTENGSAGVDTGPPHGEP
jgi:hypothetical protein